MELGFTEEQEKLRADIQSLVNEEKSLAKTRGMTSDELVHHLYQRMGERGWIGMFIPKDYGGAGRSFLDWAVLQETVQYIGTPEIIRVWLDVGSVPAFITLSSGSPELKTRFLAPMCQGTMTVSGCFTEPSSGTDWDMIETRAVEDGDYFIVNGTKIYNESHRCNYTCALVRTTPNAPKEEGLSLLMIDLNNPGITIRPLWMMWGLRRDEVAFEDVRVPKANLIGDKNRGYQYAMDSMCIEFGNIANVGFMRRDLERFIRLAREVEWEGKPIIELPSVRDKLVDFAVELETARLLYYKSWWMMSNGTPDIAAAAISKLYTTELWKRLYSALIDMVGQYGVLEPSPASSKWPAVRLGLPISYRFAPAMTNLGWPSEIQRNIIAIEGLGLPS